MKTSRSLLPVIGRAAMLLWCTAFLAHQGFSQVLHIMAYNIHHGCDINENLQLDKIASLVKESNADIVGLVEVDSMCSRSGNTDQAKILAQLTGMHYAFVRHFAFGGGAYGLALLSKFPIADLENFRLPVSTEENGDSRAFLISRLKLPSGESLVAAVVHLDYRNAGSRLEQAAIILKKFRNEKDGVVLLGDLNASPGAEEIMMLKKSFTDANADTLLTYPADKPHSKIDYILISKDHYLKTEKATSYPVLYSDHLPVLSSVVLQ